MKRLIFLSALFIFINNPCVYAEYQHLNIEKDTVLLLDRTKERAVFDMQNMNYSVISLKNQELTEKTSTPPSWSNLVTSYAYDLTEKMGNAALSATKFGLQTSWNVASGFAEWGIRTAFAYNVAYYNTEALEWGITKGAGFLASLAMGPAAGAGAEAAISTALKIGHFVVPGFEALIAGAALPVVKPATDFVINNTPNALKTAAKVTNNVTQSLWSFGKSTTNYFWGTN